jgi:hypothetical protein
MKKSGLRGVLLVVPPDMKLFSVLVSLLLGLIFWLTPALVTQALGRNFSFLLSSQVHCLICFWFCRFQFSSSGSRPGSSEIFILRHSIHFFLAIFFSVIPCSVAHRFQLPWEYCARS